MRRIISFVCFVFLVVLSGSVSAATYTVCSSGCDYTSIQAAVNVASNGDTISVGAGTYNENVDVAKSVNLVGAGADVTIISAASSSDHVFKVTADSVNISEFTVTGATSANGVSLSNSKYSKIENVTASNNHHGIYLNSSSNNAITNNNAGSNGDGIYLNSSSDNNTIANNTANSNSDSGIELHSSSYNTFTNNTANSNTQYGIYLDSSSYNTFTNNTANSNRKGIQLNWYSNNNTLTNNTANSNIYGIFLLSSSNYNTFTNNIMSANFYNFDIADSYIQTIDINNAVDGKPIYYLVGQSNVVVNSSTNAGFVGAINSDNITVEGLTLTKNSHGVIFFNTNNSRIESVTASNNYHGITLRSSSNNTLTNNTANSNDYDGIKLYSSSNYNTLTDNTANSNSDGINIVRSSNNTITGNNANSNLFTGITLRSSSGNTIANNTASNNEYFGLLGGATGILITNSSGNLIIDNIANSNVGSDEEGSYGIYLSSSSNYNTLTDNTASSNTYGITLRSSNNNTLTDNTASSTGNYGIYLSYSSSNTLYNNLFNNTNNFYFYGTGYNNSWNTPLTSGTNIVGGPYLGGNFWANPSGTGFSETCTDGNGDGICDSSYTLASGNIDYLPLTSYIPQSETYNITLTQEWNLISIPLEQDNWSVEAVLSSIDGNYSVVFAYIDGTWKKSTAARSPLTNMSLEYGYWIYMTAPDMLELAGTVPPTTTINVSTGWNLVGYPSLATQNSTDVLSPVNYSVVFAYIDGTWKKSTAARNPLTEMSPGHGYWIYADESGSYVVGN